MESVKYRHVFFSFSCMLLCIATIILISMLNGCVDLIHHLETNEYQSLGWLQIDPNDTAKKTGYKRLQDEMKYSEHVKLFVHKRGLPDYLQVPKTDVFTDKLHLAYLREGKIYELNSSPLGAVIEVYDWFDFQLPASIREDFQNISTTADKQYIDTQPDEMLDLKQKKNKKQQISSYNQFPKTDKSEIAWKQAKKINSIEAYEKYISTYPKGKYSKHAKKNLNKIFPESKYSDKILLIKWNHHYKPNIISELNHESKVEKTFFSLDGNKILIVTENKILYVWDSNNGKLIYTKRINEFTNSSINMHGDKIVLCHHFCDKNRRAYNNYKTVKIYEIENIVGPYEIAKEETVPLEESIVAPGPCNVAFCSNSKILIFQNNQKPMIWDIEYDNLVEFPISSNVQHHGNNFFVSSRDNTKFAVISYRLEINIYNTSPLKLIKNISKIALWGNQYDPFIENLTFSDDNQYIYISIRQGPSIYIFKVDIEKYDNNFLSPESLIFGESINNNNSTTSMSFYDNKLTFCTEDKIVIIDISTGKTINISNNNSNSNSNSNIISIDPKGHKVLTTSDYKDLNIRDISNINVGCEFISNQTDESKPMIKGSLPNMAPNPKSNIILDNYTIPLGAFFPISISITNYGKGNNYQLKAVLKSKHLGFNNVEIPIGTLKPNQSALINKLLPIPIGSKTGKFDVKVQWNEQNGFTPDSSYFTINIIYNQNYIAHLIRTEKIDFKSLIKYSIGEIFNSTEALNATKRLKPSISYAYQILDNEKLGKGAIGNGDGIIQKGEAVDILLTLKNTSVIPANRIIGVVDQDLPEGVVALKNTFFIQEIKPKEIFTKRFNIAVQKNTKSDQLKIKFTIKSELLNSMLLEDNLVLPIGETINQTIINTKKLIKVISPNTIIYSNTNQENQLGVVEKGNIIKTIGETNDQFKVKVDNSFSGWVSKTDVKEYIPPQKSMQDPIIKNQVIRIFKKQPPDIIIQPIPNSTTLDQIIIKGIILDDIGTKNYQVLVNTKKTNRTFKTPDRKIIIDIPIALSNGKNHIQIKAMDTDDLETASDFYITKNYNYPQIYAVIIGINNYHELPSLKYAVNDAKSVSDYLIEYMEVPEKNITLLLNDNATLLNIKKDLLTNLPEKTTKKDQVIIFWAGHGILKPDDSSYDGDGFSKYLASVDTQKKSYEATALPAELLKRVFQRLSSNHVVFIADTCFSGSSGGRTVIALEADDRIRAIEIQENFIERLIQKKGRLILCASRSNQLSIESDKLQHGVFTYFLLRGLRGEAHDVDKDGLISTDEIMIYLEKNVASFTNNKQNPIKKGEGVVILGRKNRTRI